jgi:iron complex outermembrane receptor protein
MLMNGNGAVVAAGNRAGLQEDARRGTRGLTRGALAGVLLLTSPVFAQDAPQPGVAQDAPPARRAGEPDDEETVVVSARRQRGAVLGDIPPELQLGPAEILGLGVTSVDELLAELGPELRSLGGGPPVVLLEGRRLSSFAELRDVPAEAIVRVDVLPEAVALQYGYSANQKVMNVVLRPRFRAWTGEARAGAATEGGAANERANATYLRIRRDTRLNASVQASHGEALTEAQRGIAPAAPRAPFDGLGNFAGLPAGAVLDPALSALAGAPVTVAGAPASAQSRPLTLADLVPTANRANRTDLTDRRTLLPQADGESANLVWNRALEDGTSITLNARVQRDEQRSRNGLPGVTIALPAGGAFSPFAGTVGVYRYVDTLGALAQTTESTQAHVGMTVDGGVGRWRWNVIGNLDRGDSRTATQSGADIADFQSAVLAGANPFAPLGTLAVASPAATARSVTQGASLDALLNGSPLSLPAGDARLSVRMQGSLGRFDARSFRFGSSQATSFDRDVVAGQASLDLPLTRRETGPGHALGALDLNVNVAAQRLSDFGTLGTFGYGLRWAPAARWSLSLSQAIDQAAPDAQQLQGPLIVTPNVALLDPLTGETVLVTRTSGGTPGLEGSRRQVLRIGANWTPLETPRLQLSASLVRTRIENPLAAFPVASAPVAAAFPERFVRDVRGMLLLVDARPVNFGRSATDALRWGANLSIPLTANRPDSSAAGARGPRAPGESRESRESRGRGRPGGRGGGEFGGRMQFALYHTVTFRDDILVRQGGPRVDLLDGGATGLNGGTPRQQLEAQAGASRNGLGAWLTAEWRSASELAPGALNPGGTLRFSALGTVNLRLFANAGAMPALLQRHPWLRGSRLVVSLDNLSNERQRVTDATGSTPLAYQPGYLDPTGRAVSINFRKLFFTTPARAPTERQAD